MVRRLSGSWTARSASPLRKMVKIFHTSSGSRTTERYALMTGTPKKMLTIMLK